MPALVGVDSLKLSSLGPGDVSAETPGAHNGFRVNGSEYYTLSASFLAAAIPRMCRVGIDWYSINAVLSSTVVSDPVLSSTTDWTRVRLTAAAPVNAGYMAVRVAFLGAVGVETHYVDGVMAEQSEFLSDYFDGSTKPSSDYVWGGTPHASSSHYYPRREIKDYRLRTAMDNFLPLGRSYRTFYGVTPPVDGLA